MAEALSGIQLCSLNRPDQLKKALGVNGFAVIPDVLSADECDKYTAKYKQFYEQFETKNKKVDSRRSLVQNYRIGHFQETWEIRLKIKHVFEKLWDTKKLLTSADAVAISKPPEQDPNGVFYEQGADWFHIDQSGKRFGLHAYQGAVYLEETTNEDYCFRVLRGSHLKHEDFFRRFPDANKDPRNPKSSEFIKLNANKKTWFRQQGCLETKLPVPKGGMVLWDSRTVHDSVNPVFGRKYSDRWRFVVFASMTPAMWAGERDLKKKREAYRKLLLTTHWASQCVKTFKEYDPDSEKNEGVDTITELPDKAKTTDVKRLFGLDPYDFKDGESNGPLPPKWID